MLVDFHNHTTASDGRMTPQELMAAAHRNGLGLIAITDHDALDGCRDITDPPGNLRVIPGIEFSVDDAFSEVHILGLGINIEDAQLAETVRIIRADRVRRIEKMVDKSFKPLCYINHNLIRQLVMVSPKVLEEMELLPEASSGNYRRGSHLVQTGDTLKSIAEKYDMTEEELIDINYLKTDSTGNISTITVGDYLKVIPREQRS